MAKISLKSAMKNLKRNWYFTISAMAFFCLNAIHSSGYYLGIPIAFLASLVIASQLPSLFSLARQNRKWINIVSIVSAFGICLHVQSSFYTLWSVSPLIQSVKAALPVPFDIVGILSMFGAVVAVFFVYICVQAFWKEMLKIISDNGLFSDLSISERVVYVILIAASLAFVVFSFAQTEAFYGTEYSYNIIYTSDSPALVKSNAYLSLNNAENDLRQPLFAVFAAPFVAIPYLIGKLLSASASVQAMLLNAIQVIILFVANFMLARVLKLKPIQRICFILLMSCTYMYLLFTLMMEQYIIAYFYLIFCIYLISENQHPARIALWGAGGTLLTSIILLPFLSEKHPFRDFKRWLADMLKYGLEFVAFMLAFCRFDVIFNFTAKLTSLSRFTGQGLKLTDKLYQYISFIASSFFAPDAGVNSSASGYISWQLNPVTSINLIGLVILLLVILSAVLNRDKKCSRIAIGWVAFSAVTLFALGWGTIENGLILYTLYFGWAFMLLLFQLVKKIADKLNLKFLVPAFSIVFALALSVVNIPAIMEMLNFTITYYPV